MKPVSTRLLFEFEGGRALALGHDDMSALQAFYVRNPEYFMAVEGEPPAADEARSTLEDGLPPEMPYRYIRTIGFVDMDGALTAMANVVADMFVPGVWLIGLFIVQTDRHGHGLAQASYRAMETWMRSEGAQWIRLGVVIGNARAERFWERVGYVEVRTREGLVMKSKTNDLRVMVKPLVEESIAAYLAKVPRDRPETEGA
ncbi:GNAT family N-acetyltransferase [Trinickia fusca]|uniref:GNAT family N-acetyltransferase n=1 Tax=Trinickia fusca TaxID=2419777 RepID=A0A494XX18_9BURK|nr:GNAT family N-acetyltransferase [Trinickia fusca]RKP52123.1 GNAT family N-acetyltransferase [Trinickia fusca]